MNQENLYTCFLQINVRTINKNCIYFKIYFLVLKMSVVSCNT